MRMPAWLPLCQRRRQCTIFFRSRPHVWRTGLRSGVDFWGRNCVNHASRCGARFSTRKKTLRSTSRWQGVRLPQVGRGHAEAGRRGCGLRESRRGRGRAPLPCHLPDRSSARSLARMPPAPAAAASAAAPSSLFPFYIASIASSKGPSQRARAAGGGGGGVTQRRRRQRSLASASLPPSLHPADGR